MISHYHNVLILVFSAAALAALSRLPRGKPRLIAALSVVAILLSACPSFDWLCSRPLEMWYPVRALPHGDAQAIVVLSSNVEAPESWRPFRVADQNTFTRCKFAAWLYRNWKPLPILACGGPGGRNAEPFSRAMRALLVSEGVPESSIWTEERSRSTHENALYGSEVLRSHAVGAIALVVEAQSMLRASACFRKAGMAVTPAPSDFRVWGPLGEEVLPDWRALRRNELTVHEAVGLLWYRLHGWI